MTTILWTVPASAAARSTVRVPSTAGLISSSGLLGLAMKNGLAVCRTYLQPFTALEGGGGGKSSRSYYFEQICANCIIIPFSERGEGEREIEIERGVERDIERERER